MTGPGPGPGASCRSRGRGRVHRAGYLPGPGPGVTQLSFIKIDFFKFSKNIFAIFQSVIFILLANTKS